MALCPRFFLVEVKLLECGVSVIKKWWNCRWGLWDINLRKGLILIINIKAVQRRSFFFCLQMVQNCLRVYYPFIHVWLWFQYWQMTSSDLISGVDSVVIKAKIQWAMQNLALWLYVICTVNFWNAPLDLCLSSISESRSCQWEILWCFVLKICFFIFFKSLPVGYKMRK